MSCGGKGVDLGLVAVVCAVVWTLVAGPGLRWWSCAVVGDGLGGGMKKREEKDQK